MDEGVIKTKLWAGHRLGCTKTIAIKPGLTNCFSRAGAQQRHTSVQRAAMQQSKKSTAEHLLGSGTWTHAA
jgi:hypothetical protein